MYVQPNSTIKLYHNVPLDNTYEHTLYFASLSEQNNYFHGNTDILTQTFTANSYQRVNKGKMRISAGADSLYNCNYLAFQNTNFGLKWFYAFILEVEYVNNSVSEVTYEIDVMQTYFFDVELKQTFVEREHVSDDTIGANILPEPVQIGDIKCVDISKTDYFAGYSVVVTNTVNSLLNQQCGGIYDGMFSGCDYSVFDVSTQGGVDTLKQYLLLASDHPDVIVSITTVPTAMFNTTPTTLPKSIQHNIPKKYDNIDGYTPRNNKLFTYPYNYLEVDCGNNSACYRYEWFKDLSGIPSGCNFTFESVITGNPKIAMSPRGYNSNSDNLLNYVEKLVMDGFPQISWTYDTFRAWLSQESSSTFLQGIMGAGAMIGGVATENPLMIAGGLATLGGTTAKIQQIAHRPDQAKGVDSGSFDVGTKTKNFYFRRMQLQRDYARAIDNFFTKYGYTCERVKVPNRNVRTNFTYTKTRNCVIRGNCPADDIRKMCDVYDKGITFWNNPANVGNYSVTNSPS